MRADILFPASPFSQTLPVRKRGSQGPSGDNSLFALAPKASFGGSVNLSGTGIGPDKGGESNHDGTVGAVPFRESIEVAANGGENDEVATTTLKENAVPSNAIRHDADESGSIDGGHSVNVDPHLSPLTSNARSEIHDRTKSNGQFPPANHISDSPFHVGENDAYRDFEETASKSSTRPTSFLEGATFLSGVMATSGQPNRPLATSAPFPLSQARSSAKSLTSPNQDQSISELFFAKQQGNPAAALLPTGGFKKEFDSSLLSENGDSYANSFVGGNSMGTLQSEDPYKDSDYYYNDSESDGENRYDKSDKTYGDSRYDYDDYRSDDNTEDQYGAPYYDYDNGNTGDTDKTEFGVPRESETYGASDNFVSNSQSNSNGDNGIDKFNYGNKNNRDNYKFTEFDNESNSGYAIDKSRNEEYGDTSDKSTSPGSSNSQRPHSAFRPQSSADYEQEFVDPHSDRPSGYIENYNPSTVTEVDGSPDREGYSNGYSGGDYRVAGNEREISRNDHSGFDTAKFGDNEIRENGYAKNELSDKGYNNNRYRDSGYSDSGENSNEYTDNRYSKGGYNEGKYADRDYSDGGYSDNEYGDSGYSDGGYSDNEYDDSGYSDSRHNDNGYNDNRDRSYNENDYNVPSGINSKGLSTNRNLDSQSSPYNEGEYLSDNHYDSSYGVEGNPYDSDDNRGYSDESHNAGKYSSSLDHRGFQPGISDPGPPPKNAYAGDFSGNSYNSDPYREPDIATSIVGGADDTSELSSDEGNRFYGGDSSEGDVKRSRLNTEYTDSDQVPPPLDSYPNDGSYVVGGLGERLDDGGHTEETGSRSFPERHSDLNLIQSSTNLPHRNSENDNGAFGTTYTDNPNTDPPLLGTDEVTAQDLSSLQNSGTTFAKPYSSVDRYSQSQISNTPVSTNFQSDSSDGAPTAPQYLGGTSPTFSLSPTSLVIVPDENPLILLPQPKIEQKPFESKGPQPFNRPR